MLAHACLACGHEPPAGGVYLLQEDKDAKAEARKAEADNLRQQERDAPPELREIVRLIRQRLEAEDAATDDFADSLRDIFAKVVETLRAAITGRSDLRRSILGASVDQLGQVLDSMGLLDAHTELRATYQHLVGLANQTPVPQGLPAGTVRLDTPAVRQFLEHTDDTFWNEKIRRPAAALIREGLDRALRLEPLEQTVADIQQKLETSVGRAATAARTQIAMFDRTVNTQVAQDAGIRQWIYLGPLDGLTRPFCRVLIRKVITYEQMQQLDNAQGLGTPLVSGGGFNCRHRTAMVSDATVERRGMARATAEDIVAANVAARAGRRR